MDTRRCREGCYQRPGDIPAINHFAGLKLQADIGVAPRISPEFGHSDGHFLGRCRPNLSRAGRQVGPFNASSARNLGDTPMQSSYLAT